MGRFATTAGTYARDREPYPPEFFALIAERLGLGGSEALIDLGTGPGVLALGFVPYVGSILGVDPEAAMLEEARAAAAAAHVALPLVHGRTEDLPADIGTYDIVTIGRALHWMDRPAIVAVLDRILTREGAIIVTGTHAAREGENPWHDTMEAVLLSWNPTAQRGWQHIYGGWFDETPFAETETITHRFEHPVTPEDLFNRAPTRSSTSAAALGDRIEACHAELLAALAPFFPEDVRTETLVAKANVIRRR